VVNKVPAVVRNDISCELAKDTAREASICTGGAYGF